MADQDIQILIQARDEASGVVDNLNTKIGALGNVSGAATKQTGGLFGSIVLGNLATQAITRSLSFMGQQLKESIDESLNAETAMAAVKQQVTAAGFAYDQIGPKLKAYSTDMIKMGFDDEETAKSVSSLLNITHDYSKALELNQEAMDLARSKHISLTEATTLLQQVFAGNSRALKAYGIDLDSATTSAEALDILQKRVKGSAEAFADTTAGKLDAMNEQWKNVKQMVGDELQPTLRELMDDIEQNMPTIIELVKGFVAVLKAAVDAALALAKAWNAIGDTAGAAGTAFGTNMRNDLKDISAAFQGKAGGGDVRAGVPYIVGENGPEIFAPGMSGTIVSNPELKSIAGGGGSEVTNIHVMQGAIIQVTGEADENRLASKVARELARTIQARRSGLATAN